MRTKTSGSGITPLTQRALHTMSAAASGAVAFPLILLGFMVLGPYIFVPLILFVVDPVFRTLTKQGRWLLGKDVSYEWDWETAQEVHAGV
jgi:hypothetical protein